MHTLSVQPDTASASGVRGELAAELHESGIPAQIVDDVVLIASELVANAVRHARALPDGGLNVRWRVRPEGVEVRVTDGGGLDGALPRVRDAKAGDTGGRGLSIVSTLADQWGIERAPDHTVTVWALRRTG